MPTKPAAQAVGRPFSNVELSIRPTGSDAAENALAEHGTSHASDGLIYIRSPMLFMDYVGDAHDATAVLRDGDWLSVRDMGHIDERGMLCLAGRQSRMIVTQGKNLFPEEVETCWPATRRLPRSRCTARPMRCAACRYTRCCNGGRRPRCLRPWS
jgi:acyl-CoA synthetase (AMP-forming)/AMP-acid ligase II